MADLRNFRVLLDEPADDPALGFSDYAQAFGDVILHSKPQFAIGIFGEWGSGKTTLMRAIRRAIAENDSVIPVWFNAWRYEREEHLIVPMLDTLREGLTEWATTRVASEETARGQARKAAAMIGRAARALAAGFSAKASFFGTGVEFEPKKVMDAWEDKESAENPRSFYHASFSAMRDAVRDFVGQTDRRIVIFIDDLDRCLPHSALEVLESMKLFFDLEGFVFVVGLDQKVVERAVEIKYQAFADGRTGADVKGAATGAASPTTAVGPAAASVAAQRSITGTDYIKKIFQVPFGVPRISREDLRGFFDALIETSDLPPEQQDDLTHVVWRHIDAATGADAGSVNPREVKRLINAYTLQMKMLSAKLGEPNPHVVLAIQTMAFRSGWLELYELLTADAPLFIDAVRQTVEGRGDFSLRSEPLPSTFLAYLRGPARPLLDEPSIEPYITSAETTASTDPRIADARTIVAGLKSQLARLGVDPELTEQAVLGDLGSRFAELHEKVLRGSRTSIFAAEAERLAQAIRDAIRAIQPSPDVPAAPPPWVSRVQGLLTHLDENLRQMLRESRVGAVSA